MLKKINDLKPMLNNPRGVDIGRLEKLKRSIKEFPEMMSVRPIIINESGEIIGGNMRWKALLELGYKEVEVIIFDKSEREYELLIKDNLGYGDWAWVNIAEEYEYKELTDWGLTPPVWYKDLTKEEKEPLEKIPKKEKGEIQQTHKAVYLFYTKAEKEDMLRIIKQDYKDMSMENIFMSLIKKTIL